MPIIPAPMPRPAVAALVLGTVLAVAPMLPAGADVVNGDAARSMLYPADRIEVVRQDTRALSDQEVQILSSVAQGQKYYAAVALAPSAGLMAATTVMAANHHTIEAARAAALEACEGQRSGGQPCVIAMEVRPAGWQVRDLQLSADATEGFGSDYRNRRGAALAISPSTGMWGLGRGAEAAAEALAACAGDGRAGDCAVVIAD